jgi:two-component system response regulator MprA
MAMLSNGCAKKAVKKPERSRILVVEDDLLAAETIQRVLRSGGYDAETAPDGMSALRRAAERPPDLVVLDVMLPGMDGLEICRLLRSVTQSLPILMLTARSHPQDRVRGLDSGADDYLLKPFDYQELLARVRALLRRAPPAQAQKLEFSDLRLDPATREVWRAQKRLALTAREFGLLEHFLRHPRQVLSPERLLESVWGDEAAEVDVVKVYIGYLRAKLEAQGCPRLIHTVRGAGYSLRDA